MKTIKIIDLLNMISKGEAVPKKIKVFEREYEYDDEHYIRYSPYNDEYYGLGEDRRLDMMLDYEVEIIEEDKKIEKLEKYYEFQDIDNNEDNKEYKEYYENILKVYGTGEYEIDEALSFTIDKINELIDEINKLKEVK